jgi:CheY-like chemotaxis protein
MGTILIIDDNKDYRAGLTELLTLEAHTALEAENGLIGLHLIHQHSPNLILCDVDMPVMNGLEVLATVKADPMYAKIPFLLITGHRDEQTLKTSHDLGVAACLTKPIAVKEFLTTVTQFLEDEDPTSLS